MNDSDADLSRSWKAYRPTVCPSSGMEIDQRQKDVCPPGQAGQSGKDAHILVAHGESPRAVSITLQPTSGGARFNRASNILQRGNIFMPAAEITAALTGIRSALDLTKAMINLHLDRDIR